APGCERLRERSSEPTARPGDQRASSLDVHGFLRDPSLGRLCQQVIREATMLAGGHPMSREHDHLADNIKAVREARGLSQQQIAKAAGIPRATWTHLESGGANPTLAVLVKVANALQVRLDELLAAPRQPARHLKASDLPTRERGQVAIRKLLPEPLPGLDIERMVLPAKARMAGVPHT